MFDLIPFQMLPQELFSTVLLAAAAPRSESFLKERIHNCKSFSDVIQFYQKKLNVFTWMNGQLTLEDAFLCSNSPSLRYTSIVMHIQIMSSSLVNQVPQPALKSLSLD